MRNSAALSRPADRPFYVETRYSVVYEDASILVCDKPAPLAVHPVGAYAELNLHSLLQKDPRWAGTPLRFTHRLDAETSGLIVAAKTAEAARSVGIQFMKRRVRKKYAALVYGVPDPREGEIQIPLGRDLGSGFQTVRTADYENGEAAATRYRVRSFFSARGDGERYALLDVEPMTGRTHQIRAHLSFIGHPVVGDKIYPDLDLFRKYVLQGLDEELLVRLKLPRLALHCEELSFTHPDSHSLVTFVSPAPDFAAMMR